MAMLPLFWYSGEFPPKYPDDDYAKTGEYAERVRSISYGRRGILPEDRQQSSSGCWWVGSEIERLIDTDGVVCPRQKERRRWARRE